MKRFSVTAVARIQHALRNEKFDEAIALLRASRWAIAFVCLFSLRPRTGRCSEVWQTEKAFGHENIHADDELKLLREIYLTANLQSEMKNFRFASTNVLVFRTFAEKCRRERRGRGGGRGRRTQRNRRRGGRSSNRWTGGRVRSETIYSTVKHSFSHRWKMFFSSLFSFAHSNILSSYISVLRTYAKNSPFLNHCLIRMFYRVCVDCECAPILFQMSLFRILQKFHLDPLAKSSQFSVNEFRFFSASMFFSFLLRRKGNSSIRHVVTEKILQCRAEQSVHLRRNSLLEGSKRSRWDHWWTSSIDSW